MHDRDVDVGVMIKPLTFKKRCRGNDIVVFVA